MVRFRHAITAVIAAVIVFFAPAGSVSAHAVLDNSVPASGATLVDSPPQIVLDFDEPVETKLGFIRLFSSDASRVDLPAIARDASDSSIVRVDVPRLDDDTYVVTYRVVSVDGHPGDGAITCQVGEGARIDVTDVVAEALAADGSNGAVDGLSRAIRLVSYLALALLLASGFFLLGGAAKDSTARLMRVFSLAGGGTAVTAIALLGLQGASLAGGGVGAALRWSTLSDISDTRVGHALLVRAALGVVALVVASPMVRNRADGAVVRFGVVAASVVVPLTYAFAGHPGAANPTVVAVAVSMFHIAAVGTWFGGLVLLGWSSTLRESGVVKWFSQRAAALVGIAVVTGVMQSLLIVDDIRNVLDITYGKVLVAKLVFVGAMLLAAAVVRKRFIESGTERLRPVLVAEAVVGLLVLAVTSGLVTETPRAAVSAAPFATSLVQGETIVNVTVSPARVGSVEMHVIIAKPGGSLEPVASAKVRFSSSERDVPPIGVEPAEVGPNHFVVTAQIPYAGEWKIDVVLVEVDGRESLFTTPIDVRP
ncbi:MAG: copper resistance CopC/CopD family protein [Actinomycetota bacterium]